MVQSRILALPEEDSWLHVAGILPRNKKNRPNSIGGDESRSTKAREAMMFKRIDHVEIVADQPDRPTIAVSRPAGVGRQCFLGNEYLGARPSVCAQDFGGIAHAVAREGGKPLTDAIVEVDRECRRQCRPGDITVARTRGPVPTLSSGWADQGTLAAPIESG
jgi:hypothetical protein